MKTLCAAVLLFLPTWASAQSYAIDPAHSTASFDIKNLLIATVHGTVSGITGAVVIDDAHLDTAKVEARLDVSTVATGNDKRDAHLKTADYFDVAKFPAITFNSTRVTRTAEGQYQVQGALTIHGVSKGVTLDVSLPPGAGFSRRATATLVVARKEFGITSGSIMVGDDATVALDIALVAN
jgi:polyisoprenoid-binding protein YceI